MMERKVVLITGGAMGQGRSHALKFAENGFDVVLADMQEPGKPGVFRNSEGN